MDLAGATWQPGAVVAGRFRLEARLGAGGMGEVWRAHDLAADRPVALKALLPGAELDARVRFRREGEAQARVDDHPHVVRVHAAGEDGPRAWIAAALCPGGDLAHRLRAGPLRWREAAALVRDLARGVAHLHARGVLHRDLKPANVLFDEEGRALVADFGLARLADGAASLTATGAVVGTPGYLAPEQANGERATPASDVYGLGAVLFACLAGRAPFEGGGLPALRAVLEDPPPPPSRVVAEVPPALDALVLACLAKAPADRPPGAEDLARALDAVLAGEGGPARAGRARALGLAVAAASLAVGVAVTFAIAASGRGDAARPPEAPAGTASPAEDPGGATPPPQTPEPPEQGDVRVDEAAGWSTVGRGGGLRLLARRVESPTPGPSLRFTFGRTAVWDPVGRAVLVVACDGELAALWRLDPTAGWEALETIEPPPARHHPGLALDAGRRRLVLFGGKDPSTRGREGGLSNDLFELELETRTWLRRGPDAATASPWPSPRYAPTFWHEPGTGQAAGLTWVLGGDDGAQQTDPSLGELWSWDGVRWERVEGAPSLGRRRQAGVCAWGEETLLWGGFARDSVFVREQRGGLLVDLWRLERGRGVDATPLASSTPSRRLVGGFAPLGPGVLLFGGQRSRDGVTRLEPASPLLSDAWLLRPTEGASGRWAWTELELEPGWPGVEGYPALVAEPGGEVAYLLAGRLRGARGNASGGLEDPDAESKTAWALRLVED